MDHPPVYSSATQTFSDRTAGSWRQKQKQPVTSTTSVPSIRGPIRVLQYSRSRRRPEHKQSHGDAKSAPVVTKTIVQNLNLECVKPQRAGIIPYTVVNGAIYLGMALDSRTHDLTDFGGGVIYRTDRDAIRGALREFEEETLSIFEPISSEDIGHCPVIYDDRNLIVFVHIDIDPDTVCLAFNEKFEKALETLPPQEESGRRRGEPEVCGITWLTWEEFQDCLKVRGIMFSRVQKFLFRAEKFSHLL